MIVSARWKSRPAIVWSKAGDPNAIFRPQPAFQKVLTGHPNREQVGRMRGSNFSHDLEKETRTFLKTATICIRAPIEPAVEVITPVVPGSPEHFECTALGSPACEIAPEHRVSLRDAFRTHALDAYWNGAVRMLVADQPEVLD